MSVEMREVQRYGLGVPRILTQYIEGIHIHGTDRERKWRGSYSL